jgi:enterochelin esterase-like enzyme
MRRSAASVVLAALGLTGCAHPGLPPSPGSPTSTASTAGPGPPLTTHTTCGDSHGTLSDASTLSPQAPPHTVIYLPPCYTTSGARYPTLILLHGGGADETQWPDIGLAAAADHLISQGRIAPFIAAAPDVAGGPTQTTATFVLDELLPWMDGHLRTRTTPRDRAIGGISLGGGSALRIVASHPGVFGAVGGHSPAVHPTDRDLAAALADHGPSVWLDVGRDDSLRSAVADLAARWQARHVAVELHIPPGRHDRPYWRSQMESYLLFYARGWS